jgi:hypothetical protein
VSRSPWVHVFTLTKTQMRSSKDPITKLHQQLMVIKPEAQSISEFGMGKAGLDYFREQVTKACKKKFSYLSEKKIATSIAMTLLDTEPCDVEGAKGFEVFIREVK